LFERASAGGAGPVTRTLGRRPTGTDFPVILVGRRERLTNIKFEQDVKATVISQLRTFTGRPSSGHCVEAASRASCVASSAVSMFP